MILKGRQRSIDGFQVVRTLPQSGCRQVGPYVFIDHMGPKALVTGEGLDVPPHPHIGLATVTYLFSGQLLHRDSLGHKQIISAGDLNWMTAGRGIVHSERSPLSERELSQERILHGVQIWVALPKDQETCEPSFQHYSKATLPQITWGEGLEGPLLIGGTQGQQSPVKTRSQILFAEIKSHSSGEARLHFNEEQLAIQLISGQVLVDGHKLQSNDLMIIDNPKDFCIQHQRGAHMILIGGQSFPEPRHMWWNFVASDKEPLRQAAELWRQQKMGQVPGEKDFVPLPQASLP